MPPQAAAAKKPLSFSDVCTMTALDNTRCVLTLVSSDMRASKTAHSEAQRRSTDQGEGGWQPAMFPKGGGEGGTPSEHPHLYVHATAHTDTEIALPSFAQADSKQMRSNHSCTQQQKQKCVKLQQHYYYHCNTRLGHQQGTASPAAGHKCCAT